MTALVLDAGAFIAVEHGQRAVLGRLAAAQLNEVDLRTSAIVLGQIWRGGTGRQATIARLLAAVEVVPVDNSTGQATGLLTGLAGTSDPIDAAVVLAARPGDTILTSDPIDIGHLVGTGRPGVAVVAC
jgi:predicted nucleic acid-binding protein